MQTQMSDNSPLQSNLLTKSLDSAQTRVEERAYQQRKNLFDYDEILNQQRNIIYFERRQVLQNVSNQQKILAYGEQVIADIILELKSEPSSNKKIILLLENLFGKNISLKYVKNSNLLMGEFSLNELKTYLFNEFWLTYQLKRKSFDLYGLGACQSFERDIILRNMDKLWREHLEKMSLLREAVGWRGYGQKNPLYEYKEEAFYMFEEQKEILRHLVVYNLLRSVIL